MKQTYKNILKFTIFMFIVFGLIIKLGELFTPKWTNGENQGQIYTIKGFYEMPKNSIDILFMGDSSIYKSVSPMQIYENLGIKSYNYSVSSARLYMMYYQLQDVLKYQKPKVLFVDTLTFFYDTKEIESERRKSFDYLKFSSIKEKMIHDDVFESSFDDKVSYYFPLLRYHSRWNEIRPKDIADLTKSHYSINKGFVMTSGVQPNTSGYDYMIPNNRKVEMQDYVKKYFYQIVDLCKEENIDLVFLGIPDKRAWNYESSVLMNELAKETNTKFFDLNDKDKYPVDWNIDSEDGGMHFNISGAIKITDYVSKYIDDNYNFSNCRKEKECENYEKDLKVYNKRKRDALRQLNRNIEEYDKTITN